MEDYHRLNLVCEKLNNIFIFSNVLEDEIISSLLKICENRLNKRRDIKLFNHFIKLLVVKAEEKNYGGNILLKHIIDLILEDENIFSIAAENSKTLDDTTILSLAKTDLKNLFDIGKINLEPLHKSLKLIQNYKPISLKVKKIHMQIEESTDEKEIIKIIFDYFKNKGCGDIGNNKSLYYKKGKFVGFRNFDKITLDDIVGYKLQKEELVQNTENFLFKGFGNNILLVGARGTGKSSCVKALANKYFEDGLRLIEIRKNQIEKLPRILNLLSKRGKKFIIFLDDLSYEDFETEFKFLKSLLEGSSESKPENVLFYATSNRRHLIKEKWSDRTKENYSTEEIHISDTMNEKLSLSDRFGVTIYFDKPNPKEYLEIVKSLAKKANINLDEETLVKKAMAWELNQKGLSGRTAKQFIESIKN